MKGNDNNRKSTHQSKEYRKSIYFGKGLSFFLILSVMVVGTLAFSIIQFFEIKDLKNSIQSSPSIVPDTKEMQIGQVITLTKENIQDYFAIISEYTDSKVYSKNKFYCSSSIVNIKSYCSATGSFSNVSMTLRITPTPSGGGGEKWHLTGTDDEDITISFVMPASGQYSEAFGIECMRLSKKLKDGKCDFEIVSASGTFIPN